MSNCNTILSVLTSNGSDQKQRYLNALQPENIRLNDFELTDWVLFAHNFSEYVNYFETSNPQKPSGDWKPFFDFFKWNGDKPSIENQLKLDRVKKELADLIAENKKEYAITPHLTLFLTFLMLLENSKKRYNNLTKRHLDFYYNQILHIDKLPATPDKVYLIFELAKNAIQEKIETKTGFDGGKDVLGKPRSYYSNNELIANKTVVSSLKNIYNDVDTKKIKASPIANSYDGLGKAFPDKNNTQWWPFGYIDKTNVLPELPNAAFGFAIASPILALAEGKRSIQISFTFQNNITAITTAIIKECLSIQLTTAKKWLEVAEISSSLTIKSGSTYTTSVSGKTMKIAFLLDENTDAITGYDSKVYGEEFATNLPVAKFNLDITKTNGYDLYKSLAQNKLENIIINIDVQNIKSAVLENDNGSINAAKPFFAFSPQPVAGSNFLIKYNEAFSKKWENVNVDILWKNTPANFVEHYKAYKTSSVNTISVNDFKTSVFDGTTFVPAGGIVTSNNYFQYRSSILSNNIWQDYGAAAILFTTSNPFKTTFNISNTNYITDKNGQLRLTLTTSFLHDLYPKIYALALSVKSKNVVIPNEPYTPLVESLLLNYTASETTKFSATGAETLEGIYTQNKAKLFQIHPFGYAEEHSYLKSLLDYVESEDSYLLPTYCKGGELFIGLQNVQELQQITLLFQVLEGSENPTALSFTGKQKIEWSVLGNNEWRILNYSDILLNETDNLLQSGILKFSLPKEATQNNTRLPKNYIWLKAKMHKQYDVVCKIIGIHSQAVLAAFQDNANDLAHLNTGLQAGTISKLLQRLSNVKSVTQPYNSFDYKPEEANKDYYKRISERLRHKNRAVTMWDYEHIVLQKFPELYKVKCLNHTCDCSYQSPGNVTLVVIPDTVNKNVFDIYQPRVSTATLNKVKNHIDQLNSMHVTTYVINPKYEEVKVDLKVKFKPGFDENFYMQELNADIIKFLSPWALDKNVPITFGVSIHSSVLINYIEKLGYVDYLQDVKLLKDGALSDKVVVPSNPKSILVSAKSHIISTDVKKCTVTTIEPQEECQL
ncbi:Baseplate J-like protein [Flavobacterium sp. CF108]|uniref:baseplate J/gp47 family protein n=1 Tax=unclassified Flavobacterium TaxID=196869 RepID=UPI0008C7EA3D|nr:MULTISPECIES: baseplate J/gp47 family protein [unclassified Flavobacterium]SEP23097.1 Baseplate J-like protein [Flavobacterium sp. fv08]SHI00459.1 Baseplate J-like protein [Flavobacterium sp. CF108]